MKKLFAVFWICTICTTLICNAETLLPEIAIENARQNCGSISDTFKSMKTKAQINTAVTGIGTAAGAGALIAGLTKAQLDARVDDVTKYTNGPQTGMTQSDKAKFYQSVQQLITSKKQTLSPSNEKKSKNLGNWRTGLLAGNTATNIAATIIATNNRTSESLRTRLDKCNQSIRELQNAKMQAHLDNADAALIQKINNIIDACRDYSTLDVNNIDTKAKGATISSGVGIAVGAAGTITSATANSDKIRKDNTDAGIAREKNLNTASNVLAAGATVASGVATVFNAQQIKTLNRAHQIATQCSEALNQ